MTWDQPSIPEPPGQSKVRVLREVEGVTLTNVPDPDRLAAELKFDNPLGRALLGPLGVIGAGCASVPTLFKGFGWLVLGLGGVMLPIILIKTIFSEGPKEGKLGLIGFQVGFLVFWVAFGWLWLFMVDKIFPPPDLFWRLEWARTRGCCGGAILGRSSAGCRRARDRAAGARPSGTGDRGDGRRQAAEVNRADDTIRRGLDTADARRAPREGHVEYPGRRCPAG